MKIFIFLFINILVADFAFAQVNEQEPHDVGSSTSAIISDTITEQVDSTQIIEDTNWSYSVSLAASNKAVKKGILISDGNALLGINSDLTYQDFSIALGASKQFSENKWSDYSIDLDYSHSFNDWFDLSLGVSQFKYFNDTLNPNSENSNSVSITTSLTISDFSFDLGFQRYIGNIPVNYFSGSISYVKIFGGFVIFGILDVTNASYAESDKTKLKNQKQLTNLKSLIFSGILSLKYNFENGFDIGLISTIASDNKSKVTPIFKLKVGYSLDF